MLVSRGVEVRVPPNLWDLHDAVARSTLAYSMIQALRAEPPIESWWWPNDSIQRPNIGWQQTAAGAMLPPRLKPRVWSRKTPIGRMTATA